MTSFKSIFDHFNLPFVKQRSIQVLRWGVLLFFVVDVFQRSFMLDICYGPQKISPPLNQRGLSNYLLNGLDEGGIGLAITIMTVLVICLIGAILTSYKRTFTFIAFFAAANLVNSTYLLNSGGHHLMLIVLFFLGFINERETKAGNWSNALNKGAVLAIQIQVCMVYFVSALYKLLGDSWMEGSAIWHSLLLEEYSLPIMNQLIDESNFVFIFMTYFLLGFQLLFPILIWLRATRKWILILGLCMHAFIAIGLGLLDFGLAMIAAYAVFDESICFKLFRNRSC